MTIWWTGLGSVPWGYLISGVGTTGAPGAGGPVRIVVSRRGFITSCSAGTDGV